jgi:hypothetical protein
VLPCRRWRSLPRLKAEGRQSDPEPGTSKPDKGKAAESVSRSSGDGGSQQQQQQEKQQQEQQPDDEQLRPLRVDDPEDLLLYTLQTQEEAVARKMAEIKQDLGTIVPPWQLRVTAGASPPPQQQAGPTADAAPTTSTPTAEATPSPAAAAPMPPPPPPAAEATPFSPGDRLATAFERSFSRLSAKLSGNMAVPEPDDELQGDQPFGTYLAVVAIWAVFLLEWAPVLPSVWAAATSGSPQHMLAPLLTSPGSETTMALLADGVAILEGKLHLLATAGLLHSGLLSMLWSADGISDAGVLLEHSLGFTTLLVMLGMCAAFASALPIMFADQRHVLAGVGTMAGMYTALATAGLRDHSALLVSPRGLVYMLISLIWSWYHPLIGLWSMAGGMLGGVLSVFVAPWLAVGARLAVGLPLLVGLAVARIVWKLLGIVVVFFVQMVQGTVQAIAETVKIVRNL